MRLLGIVPARSGSKRIPAKNVRILGGLPLLAHTIRAASRAGCLERILVSTDDAGIAALAVEHGAEAPWLRSDAQSGDRADVTGAVLEVLDRLREEGASEPEGVMLLQPTSPFRSAATIRRAAELFAASGGESVVSVGPARTHPYWAVRLDEAGRLHPFMERGEKPPRAQDLPPVFELNGLIYVATPATLRGGGFYSSRTLGMVVEDPREALDIDTPFDWRLAEALLGEAEADA